MKLYHGTNQVFEKFSQDKARVLNDYYGGGVAYFTDNFDVAHTYAKSMARNKGGDLYVFEVNLNIGKLFDVDNEFSGKEVTDFITNRSEMEDFARGAGLLKYGSDKYSILASLELGNIPMTGDQIFKGLSSGMNKTAVAREKLKRMGYTTLRYNGGVNMQTTKHNVYIAFRASDISITTVYLFDALGKKYKRQ